MKDKDKNKLWDVDAKLFASMRDKSLTPNEANFFKNMQYKEEYEVTALNDLLVSEYENDDEIYVVRMYFEEYVVGHGIGTDGAEEVHVMNLSEALNINLKNEGFIDRDITLWQWLREKDYEMVNYDRNHDFEADDFKEPDYIKTDDRGCRYNSKYPPAGNLAGFYHGYENNEQETLFYDFAVQRYDLTFIYKGKRYHFLSNLDHVALCDDHYTKEYQVFKDGNTAIEEFKIDGKSLAELVNELEEIESV